MQGIATCSAFSRGSFLEVKAFERGFGSSSMLCCAGGHFSGDGLYNIHPSLIEVQDPRIGEEPR